MVPKKTLRSGIYVYDLRKADMTKSDANRLAEAIRNSGKKARVIRQSRGRYAVYAK